MLPLVLGTTSWQPYPWWIYLIAGFLLGVFVGIGLTRLNARVLWRSYLDAKRDEAREDVPEPALTEGR